MLNKKWLALLVVIFCTLNIVSMAMSLSLESTTLIHNASIPKQYTCNGENISPALQWHGTPAGTQSYVLIVDDPDAPAGTWVHWLLFNIPATLTRLDEATKTPAGAISGKNSWDQQGYGGPCPPSGTHRYFFKLYALDSKLTVNSSVNKQDILNAMQNHILDSSELIGLYKQG